VSLIKHYRELNGCHIPYKYRKHGRRGRDDWIGWRLWGRRAGGNGGLFIGCERKMMSYEEESFGLRMSMSSVIFSLRIAASLFRLRSVFGSKRMGFWNFWDIMDTSKKGDLK
jgi:hypothetical protein